MVTLDYIEKLNSLNLDEVVKIDEEVKEYISWNKLSETFKEKLEFIGEVDVNNNEQLSDDGNYWYPDTPISLNQYPYFGCKLYKHKFHDSYYFVYEEFGGNIPEERCRLLQQKLIIK